MSRQRMFDVENELLYFTGIKLYENIGLWFSEMNVTFQYMYVHMLLDRFQIRLAKLC